MLQKISCVLAVLLVSALAHASDVVFVRIPDGGIQPQTALDAKGILHLLYFKGVAQAGDIFYVKSSDFGTTFSAPLRVNSDEQSVIAIGNIRGARLALGKKGRVHAAWMGSGSAQPRGPNKETPFLYSRLNDEGTAFEPQRNLVSEHYGLDGGGAVVADETGNVSVIWGGKGVAPGENNRRVYAAHSGDEGKTFAPEAAVNPVETGMCACCGITALASAGRIDVLYRAANEKVNRGMTMLTSLDQGKTFKAETLDAWKINTCPMSTANLSASEKRLLRAWENSGQVFFSAVGASTPPIAAPGPGRNRKHPVVAQSSTGEILLAWTEGMGWEKGGRIQWQLYDKDGKPTGQKGGGQPVPVWSLIAAVPTPTGFLILH